MQLLELAIRGKKVLEIGGPSALLNPIYPLLNSISFLNLRESMAVHAQGNNPPNTDSVYYGDAADEQSIIDHQLVGKFDAVISSHTLEHFANPLKALKMWGRCLSTTGYIVTIVPNKNACWDKDREYTPFEHIMSDYETDVGESDMTHLHESACMMASRPSYYQDVGESNSTRVIHHHVYSLDVLAKCHEFVGFKSLYCSILPNDDLQMVYVGCME
jgi:SAM-dependent methyltransferase